MVGSIFSGTTETPGEIINMNGKEFKEYRGMASYGATVKKLQLDGQGGEEVIHVEGEKITVEHKDSVELIVKKFLGGLASGMTYVGAEKIEELCGKADFVEISSAGYKESIAHGLKKC